MGEKARHFSRNDVEKFDDLALQELDVGDDMQLVLGAGFSDRAFDRSRRDIYGDYGLVLSNDGYEIAVIGFNLQNQRMLITHTPQGVSPPKPDHPHPDYREPTISRSARRRLVSPKYNFRKKLISKAIDIAKQLGLQEVVGLGYDNNPVTELKVAYNFGGVTENRMLRIIDSVFIDNGFTEGDDGNFHHSLS